MTIEQASHHQVEWSTDRDVICRALMLVQQKMTPLPRTQTATIQTDKGTYSYRYADLSDTWDAARPLLISQGLYLHQSTEVSAVEPATRMMLVTELIHVESNQYVRSYMQVPFDPTKPQRTGAWLSYARRYHMQTLLGMATEDPDADLEGKAAAALADTRNKYVPFLDKLLKETRSEERENHLMKTIDELAPWQYEIIWKDLNTKQKATLREWLSAARNRHHGIDPVPDSEKDQLRKKSRAKTETNK